LNESKSEDDESSALAFYYVKEDPIVAQIKGLMSYQEGAPILGILDIPKEGTFYSKLKKVSDITVENVSQFIKEYRAGSI